MEKYIYDENNGLWYELQGDYYIPCLKLPDEEQVEIGIWGQRHLEHIKHHRKGFYTLLVIGCELNRYLADVDKHAEEMFSELVNQMKILRRHHRTTKSRRPTRMGLPYEQHPPKSK